MILAVGDRKNDPVPFFDISKGALGDAKRGGQVCALPSDRIGIQPGEKELESGVIDCQWADGNGGSGEGDQSDAISFEAIDQPADLKLRLGQPVGGDVVGQH